MSGTGTHVFWILSRGTGIAAIMLASLSVIAGLLAGRGRPLKLGRFGEIKPLHEALSVATIVMVTAHGLLLLGDPWLKPGLTGITVPFQMAFQPFWTGVGIISGYGLILLGLSYYVRRWIGVARWRVAHRFVAVFWILGLFHTFGAGTDAGELWLQVPVAATAIPALVLLGMRFGVKKTDGPSVNKKTRSSIEFDYAEKTGRGGTRPYRTASSDPGARIPR
ncbi:MAG: ferric reductase-like transmembrane domain-containing protein [Solirubrobacterales bacterium]|nr:ferric reductase-like transmembrane domain-containing protein [Solirubrobacterales bacterium]